MPLKRSKGLAIMNLRMAATYDPDPRAPLGFRIPFNAESGEPIPERWANWRRNDPVNLVTKYRANLKSLRGIYIYIDCGWRDQYHIHYGAQLVFEKSPGGRVNVPPAEGGHYYGLAKIDGRTGALKVQLKDLDGAVLYEKTLA